MRDVATTASNEQGTSATSNDARSADTELPETLDVEAERQKLARELVKINNSNGLTGWDITWLDMLMELRKVKDDTGVAWVSGGRLGKFCTYQRTLMKKNMKGERTALTEGRIKLLNDISFPWVKTKATPKKQHTSDGSRVVSPNADPAADDSAPPTPKQHDVAVSADESPLNDQPAPPSEGSTFEQTQETPEKIQSAETATDEEGRAVSPSSDGKEDPSSSLEDDLKGLLAACNLEHHLCKFRLAGITLASHIRSNLQDVSFMERLVSSTGLSGAEAIRLQIRASSWQ